MVAAMLTASVAIVLLSIWLLAPVWLAFRERFELEPKLQQISLGDERGVLNQLFPGQIHLEINTDLDAGRVLRCEPHYRKYHVYCLVTDLDRNGPQDYTLRRLQIHRLPMPEKSYKACTQRGQKTWKLMKAGVDEDQVYLFSYAADFLESLAGHINGVSGFSPQVIHCDPQPNEMEREH